jgi:hypothetical protein
MVDYSNYFSAASAQYPLVSQSYLATTAQYESNMNPNAWNKSGAAGLFQFMPSTAAQYGLTNPYDPEASTYAAAKFANSNATYLMNKLGFAPSDDQLYLAHQQGAAGAAGLLANPDAPASSIVGYQAVYQNLPSSMKGQAGSMTAAEFAKVQSDAYAKRGGATGNTGAAAPGAATTGAGGAAPGPTLTATGDWIADYFLRAVVIILGFIFVGAGLGMFRAPAVIANASANRKSWG